ncbi:MAG: class I SAM-dependent methyltransferase [Alphaproteobacteria bacterium]
MASLRRESAMLFISMLRRVIRNGHLTLIDAQGRAHVVEAGSRRPRVAVRLHDRRMHRRLLLNPQLALGEAYMDGTLTVEEGGIDGLLDLLMSNTAGRTGNRLWSARHRFRMLARGLAQYNPIPVARRNVAHHYDLSTELFETFLDPDMQYSCAYFREPGRSLDEAQESKKRHLAAKLLLKPGQRVLDIGSGWGGLALGLAEAGAGHVTGVTLSREQAARARERAEAKGLGAKVDFQLKDYREVEGPFDRIVSVGMFEHVGVNHYARFFEQVNRLLADDGVAVLHSIGRLDGPGVTNPWIAKYIFPGGYTPALSEVIPKIERSGLLVTDVEILRLHYAETLKEWRRRFRANWKRMAELYDERFCRMWEFYLTGSEMGFRHQGLMVFQIQMAKRIDAVPMTRDYIYEWERTAEREAARGAEARRGEAA